LCYHHSYWRRDICLRCLQIAWDIHSYLSGEHLIEEKFICGTYGSFKHFKRIKHAISDAFWTYFGLNKLKKSNLVCK
jgi:hypothetical protein